MHAPEKAPYNRIVSFDAVSSRARKIPASATVAIADAASDRRRKGESVLDFSAGRASEHTFPYIVRAATEAMASGDTHQTMAQGKPDFRAACAAKLARDNGIDADPETEIVATLGCKQGLFAALLATLDPGDEVIVEDPGFVSYEPAIRYAGGVARPVRLDPGSDPPFRFAAGELESAVTPRTRGIILCSPHNPTGAVHTEQDLARIAALAREHRLLVYADETYERLTWDGRAHRSITTLEGMRERTITLMGLTKAFCMGGWRIGFALAPPVVIDAMLSAQQHLVTCASSFAQTAAVVAYRSDPPEEVRALWREWESRTRHVTSSLDAMPGLSCAMPEGAFYAWVDIRARGESSESFSDRLLRDHGVAVVPGSAFGPSGEGYVRVTCARSWEEIEQGLTRFEEAMRG